MIKTNTYQISFNPILDFAVDDNYVYGPDSDGFSLHIKKIDISTGLEVNQSSSYSHREAVTLIEDEDYVFLTTKGNKSSNISSLNTRVLLKSNMSSVYSSIGSFNRMVIDGDYLYGVSENAVTKVHKTNFSKTDIITGDFSSTGIAVSRYKIFVALQDGSINIYSKTDYSLLGNFTTGGSVSDMQIGT